MSEEKKEVAVAEKTQPVRYEADYANGFYSSSDNFKLAWQMSQGLAQSNIIPRDFQNNPSNCLIALEQSQRLNMSPFQVMQNLHIIQGKPSWSSSFLIATINASGKYDMELQFALETDKDGNPYACTCWTEKDGRRITGARVTMDMAKAEGWTAKNGSKWKTMPELMLRYRSAAFFSRLNCPEISLGMQTREELMDISEKPEKKTGGLMRALVADADPVNAEVVED